MLTLASPSAVQEMALEWKRHGAIALVPTMGALHDGHLALVQHAKQLAAKVIVSIFVNPLQFGPSEDFSKYPRTFAEDSAKLKSLGVDCLFHPDAVEFYPSDFRTRVHVSGLTSFLCGASRPGFFEGVTTVCLKLFQTTLADLAVFGEKDFQQFRVLEQMTRDLNLPLTIVGHPIVREPDGLALSSRNRYLSTEERKTAAKIPRALNEAVRVSAESGVRVEAVLSAAEAYLNGEPLSVEYLTVASSVNLLPVARDLYLSDVIQPRIFAAIRAGTTRLIDNVALKGSRS